MPSPVRTPRKSPHKQQPQQQRSPYKSPYKQQLWEMDDDAFLNAMSGPFMSPDLPKDVKDVEIEEYHETILRRYSQQRDDYGDDNDNDNGVVPKYKYHYPNGYHPPPLYDDDSCCGATTQSISTSTTLSKSMSDSEEDGEGEEVCLDDDYYYHAQVPITPHGLLLMLKPKIAKDWVMFDGYAKQPDGTPGPSETMQLFRHERDVILAMDNIPIQGLGFKRTLELLQDLILTKRQQHPPITTNLPTITFRMMDSTRSPAIHTTTAKTRFQQQQQQQKLNSSKPFMRFRFRQRFHKQPQDTPQVSSVQVLSTTPAADTTTDSNTSTTILIHAQ